MVKVISGGQTGVDRAALDAAIGHGLPYGGWCPQGGAAEDAPEPPGVLARYVGLRETPGADPRQRTEWNIRDAAALLVLVDAAGLSVSQGTAFADACAKRLGKPRIVIDLDHDAAFAIAAAWLAAERSQGEALALCIAGPRESEAPGIYAKAREFLGRVLACQG